MNRANAETSVTMVGTASPSLLVPRLARLRFQERFRSFVALLVLTALLPVAAAAVGIAWIVSCPLRWSRSNRRPVDDRKTVLLSGGKMSKALQLARAFKAAGHRVLLCETEKYACSGSRFSAAVDAFFTTPRPDGARYGEALERIVREEGVDVYVPVCSPLASRFDAKAGSCLTEHCEVIHASPDTVELLDDKFRFASTARGLGLGAPKSYLITDAEEVLSIDLEGEKRRFILKSIAYDPVRRLDLTRLPRKSPAETREYVRRLPISDRNPWVLQEFIPGEEFCTHSTVREGKVTAHCCCRSSEFQVNYEHVDEPEIEAWVRKFAEHLKLTGQVSFDFIRASDDGRLYGIECNPRTHSAITTFYADELALSDAYLDTAAATLKPSGSSRPTFWLYHELWRLVCSTTSPNRFWSRVRTIVGGKEAVFRWSDPLPFLMVNHFQIAKLLVDDLRTGNGWVRIDFNIGKLVQAAGD